jgi:TonB family protein
VSRTLITLLWLLAWQWAGQSAVRAQTSDGLGVPVARPDDQVNATKLSKLPKQIKVVQAEYPKQAAANGVEAEVVLLLDITAEGKVAGVALATPASPTGYGFDEAAMAAARDFQFEPAELAGKPIGVQLSYRYKFKLTAKPAAVPLPSPAPSTPSPPAPSAAATPVPVPVINLAGILRERGTRLPLAGALVTVFRNLDGRPIGFEATADREGRFHFFDLAVGDWKVLVDPPGYYPFRTTETISPGEALDVTYYVERGSYNPFDVTVTADRPRKEVNRTMISAKEIGTVPGTTGDPLAVVQDFAGVARNNAPGILAVRGSAPEDTQVFVDGAVIPLIYHFGGLRSVIPIGLLDSIEFYPGNFSPYYGRATGGIIDVQLKILQPPKTGGYADVNLLDAGFYLETPVGNKGGIAFAARRSYIDLILGELIPDNAGVSLQTAPRYYDFQVLATYRPTPAHDLRAFFIGSDDRLELLLKNPALLDSQLTSNRVGSSTTFYRSLLTYRFVPREGFENKFQVSQGRNWIKLNAGNVALDVDVYESQVRDTLRQKVTDGLALTLGVDAVFAKTDLHASLPPLPKEGEPPAPLDLSMTRTTNVDGQLIWAPAVFAEAEVKPIAGGPTLLPGVRVDHFTRISETIVQPRLTIRWQVSRLITAKGGLGLFAQAPQFDEADKNLGNPNLKSERAWHYSAGIEVKPRSNITVDATVFYKQLSHLVSPTDRVTGGASGVATPLTYDNGGQGRIAGLELVARHEFSHNFAGWLAYTLSRSERRHSGASSYRLFDLDETHILTAVGTYLLPRNWQVGGRFRLVSGTPITPVVGAVANVTADRYDPIYGAINSERVGAFHQLDVRIDKRWIYQRWMLNLYLDILNIYNRANPSGVTYNFDYRKSKSQLEIPILPILGIRADF